MKRKLCLLVLCAALVLPLMGAPVRADKDMDYTGRVDPATGSPYGRTGSATSGRVSLSDTMYYDYDSHEFVYPLAQARGEVRANVADGMVTTASVRVFTPRDAGVVVYRDGEEFTGDLTTINERGEYAVVAETELGTQRLLTFTILGASTNRLNYFNVPDGFYLVSVTFGEGDDAQEYPTEDRYSVALRDEGPYHIEYECSATDIKYTLDTIIDRTPPHLSFNGKIDEDGNVHSELTFTGLKEGDYIALTHEGEAVKNVEINSRRDGGTIYDSGSYVMQVFDDAGNMTQYEFMIMMYFNAQSWLFVALILLVFAGVGTYILVQRKRLKIG